jgi:isochorismate synthase/2-succinyl-5-enolpyruvyl-6-hydroxy-3-cyclohexene-1-carboxylate synthase/2-succinyl-6-hydroxy-2,4-cyclohexadiene-1-carboxylate synthase/O-succinylbenzoate synthase
LAMHKQLQAAVAAAVHKAYGLLTLPPPAAAAAAEAGEGSKQQQQQQQHVARLPLQQVQLAPQLMISSATVSIYSLKLAKPLTSTDSKSGAAPGDVPQYRQGLLLKLTLTQASSPAAAAADVVDNAAAAAAGASVAGLGEAAPLPGLHTESLQQASEQLQMLIQLLQGIHVPQTLPLLGSGSMTRWFRSELGLDPAVLYPSVRCAVEGALLQALAATKRCSLQELLQQQQQQQLESGSSSSSSSVVHVNGLLPGSGSVDELVSAGQALAAQGYRAIKVKVGRR